MMAIQNISRGRTVLFTCDTESERPNVEYANSLVWVTGTKKLYWSENGTDYEITGGGGGGNGDVDGGSANTSYLLSDDIDAGGA
jgi:hypothetical protein